VDDIRTPRLLKADPEWTLAVLRQLLVFEGLALSYATVQVADIRPLCRNVYAERIESARALWDAIATLGVPPYVPLIECLGDDARLIAPPVVEVRPEGAILCDGMHRVSVARERGATELVVLEVRGATRPLPGKVNDWGNVQLCQHQLPHAVNFIDYEPAGYTGYSSALKGSQMLTTCEECLRGTGNRTRCP
jgi:hypothetical protein